MMLSSGANFKNLIPGSNKFAIILFLIPEVADRFKVITWRNFKYTKML